MHGNRLMGYVTGQVMGALAAVCCFIMPCMKKKRDMLIFSMLANLFVALNLIMIDKIGSAVIINLIAMIQILSSLYHLKRQETAKFGEKVVFLILYTVLGCMGIRRIADILPVFGAVLFMVSVFERDEQKTRLISLGNIAVFLIYYVILGSTAFAAQIVSFITTAAAYLRYKKTAVHGCGNE